MPLHLLGKKSWNVYNHDNLERVERDKAIAAAYEEEVDRQLQEHDAAVRLAKLRGVTPPQTPTPPPKPQFGDRREQRVSEGGDGRDRKRRRLAGEDDTDRDIRLARTQHEDAEVARDRLAERTEPAGDAPLYDARGHINLFATSEKDARREQKIAEAEAEKRKKKQELEEANSMHFADAGGRGKHGQGPWYAAKQPDPNTDASVVNEEESKDVWGRPDPKRKEREAQRLHSSDPLAFMKKAQVQLKQSERDKKAWDESRRREEKQLRRAARRDKSRRKRSLREDDEDIEGLNLYNLCDQTHPSRRTNVGRDRSRSRSPHHDGHRSKESRDQDGKRRARHTDENLRHDAHLGSHLRQQKRVEKRSTRA